MEPLAPIREPHKDSVIMAYGIAPDRGWSLALVVGVVIFALLGLVSLVWFGLTRPLRIPDRTALMVSLTPRTVQKSVGAERLRELPDTWLTALSSGSRWPIVLGAYRTEEGWEYFAIQPRWQARRSLQLVRESSGLVSLLAKNQLPNEMHPFSYSEPRRWWKWKASASFAMWADPQAAFLLSANSEDWAFEPFTATYQDGILTTSIAFKSSAKPQPLNQADISLALPDDESFTPYRRTLLELLRLGSINVNQLPVSPIQANLELDDAFHTKQEKLTFAQPVTAETAKLIFSGLGLTRTRLIQLPDGSLINERVSLDSAEPDWFFGEKDTGRFGKIEINGSNVRFGDLTNNFNTASASCPKAQAWARLSGKLTTAIVRQALGFQSFDQLPGVEFASQRGKLVICRDK